MWLNGFRLRTFSVLGIRICVAGLYLERPNDDADAIIHSPDTELLAIHFLRNVKGIAGNVGAGSQSTMLP
jgi:hypothetical protein